MKNQAIKDLKNASINIAFESIEKLMLNSLDKSKLDSYNKYICLEKICVGVK